MTVSRRMRILAVDDDPLNIEMIQEILAEDYELRTATSGEEGLEVAARFRPDLILLDIMMPGIDGYEVCRRIRANAGMRHVKVVFLSAKALTKARVRGYEAGIDDYVTKPFNETELLAKVRVYLRLKSVEEIDEMKSQLLSLVAHEIRTPLTGIVPAGEMLSAAGEMEESERRMWGDMVLQNSRRLLAMAEKGMLLCQFRSGHVRPRPEPLDLVALARAAAEAKTSLARERDMAIAVHGPASLQVEADGRYLATVLESMLDNALRYGLEGSEVRLDLRAAGDDAVCAVTNRGAGIAAEQRDAVFDAFSAREVEHQVVGSGMSMALARAIVEAHGGGMDMTSAPGEETTFTCSLPVRAAAAAPASGS